MTARAASRLAWSTGIGAIALMMLSLVLMFLDRHVALPADASVDHWDLANVLSTVVNVAVPTIGILLASRRPTNPIGWLFLAAGITLGIGAVGAAYSIHALVANHGFAEAGRFGAWVAVGVGLVPFGLLAFLFLLFPSGRLRSARWRPVAWVVACAFTLVTLAMFVFATRHWTDPFAAVSPGGVLGVLTVAPLLLALAASVVAIVVRFRLSHGDERLQLKWFAAGAVLVVAAFLASFFSSGGASRAAFLSILLSMAFVLLWSAIAVAVLKYRLYDIDRIINRTLVYGLLTAVLVGVYAGLVLGLEAVVGSGNAVVVAGSTLVVAALFNPLRRRLQSGIDRRFYRRRYDATLTLEAFGARLRDQVDLEELTRHLVQTVTQTVQPATTSLWLRGPTGG